jgi:hypothetical protein
MFCGKSTNFVHNNKPKPADSGIEADIKNENNLRWNELLPAQ